MVIVPPRQLSRSSLQPHRSIPTRSCRLKMKVRQGHSSLVSRYGDSPPSISQDSGAVVQPHRLPSGVLLPPVPPVAQLLPAVPPKPPAPPVPPPEPPLPVVLPVETAPEPP